MRYSMNLLKKIQFNSPIILGLVLLSLVVLLLDVITSGTTTSYFFSVYRSSLLDPLTYVRFFGHIVGHGDLNHLTNNMIFLLVIGPALEEKYGSRNILMCILLTALLSGILQWIFFPGTAMLGASGIVFMLIILSSFSGMENGKIPLTLILVAIIYLGQEVYAAIFVKDNVSQFAHIIGGLAGTGLGFLLGGRKPKR